MSNIDSIIAQVMSEFSNFSNYIDEDTLYREAVLSTKEIGNIATEYHETVVDIIGGYANLPDQFYKLDVALLVKEYTDEGAIPLEVRTHIDTEFVLEENVSGSKWIDCDTCCKEKYYGFKETNLFITKTYNNSKRCYGNFEPVSITKHSIKSACLPECLNKTFNKTKQISVDYRKGKISANFNEGSLYIKFKGFPTDDEGNLDYNDTANGNFERYIEYCLKEKIAEILIPIPAAGAIVQSMGFYTQKKSYYKLKANQEKLYENYDQKRFKYKLEAQNRIDYNRLANR
jgi:hypothetical protein